jgi:hypothetical protein
MRYAIVPILLSSLLAISQADARGASGGHGGGHAGVHVGLTHPGFIRHQPVARFAHGFPNRAFARNRQNGFDNGLGFWGWPVGDWDWGDWGGGYPYQPAQAVQDAPVQPQVIVIHTDGQGQMQTAQAAPDVSYVKGCHAIPNGYHCDAQ